MAEAFARIDEKAEERSAGTGAAEPAAPQARSGLDIVKEAGDRLQPAVARHDPEIRALGDRRGVGRAERPGEAHAVAMAVRLAGQGEDIAGKALVNGADQRVDLVMAAPLHHRIDIGGVLRPGFGDEVLAPLLVGLVPQRDVFLGNERSVGHRKVSFVAGPFRLAQEDRPNRRRASITAEVMAAARRPAYPRPMQSQALTKIPTAKPPSVGALVRHWRQLRRMSQLDLACEADISTRHLSFIETGRSAPSRDMVLHLAESLGVPIRERNALLLAAGYAPAFQARDLSDPVLRPVREAIDALLSAHEPFPALAVDRHWILIAANRAVAPLTAGAAPELLKPPVNVMRLSLHPQGVAPRIANLAEWRDHLLFRLRRQHADSADAALGALIEELAAYPCGPSRPRSADSLASALAVPLRLKTESGILSFLSATMMFDASLDATLSEIALETFLPADAETAAALRLKPAS